MWEPDGIIICFTPLENPEHTALLPSIRHNDQTKVRKGMGKSSRVSGQLISCVLLNLSTLLCCSGRLQAKSEQGATHGDKIAKVKKEVWTLQVLL